MAGKSRQVMKYISGMTPGEKISVRGLAELTGVSEGTAYKCIKEAESQGLVTTRPRTGTVRCSLRTVQSERCSTLDEAARCVGAICICGAATAKTRKLQYLEIADGSPTQFLSSLRRTSGTCLCLMGDRRDLQMLALEQGADLLLTGGAEPDAELIAEADKAGCCIFATEQNTVTVLDTLNQRLPNNHMKREMGKVRDWMQLPRYLYTDDMVSEWHRIYSDIYYDNSGCAIVDDSLRICGSVEAMTAMAVPSAVRMSEIMSRPEEGSIVKEDMPMEELAERLIRQHRLFAAVNSPGGMSGYVGLSDVVRYYQHILTYSEFEQQEGSSIQLSSERSSLRERYYMVKIDALKDKKNRSNSVNLVTTAAAWHALDVLGTAADLESGTFYVPYPLKEAGEYNLSSRIMKRSADSLTLELELFDDRSSYIKCTMTAVAR